MPPQVSDEQLGQAILYSAKDGSYPASEEVISADVPASALPVALQLLRDAREEVKADIRERSRETAPDVDGWISQAKQLQAEIEESRALAREIVRQSDAGNALHDQVGDASSKVDLLKGEVIFNETLVKTLEHIQHIHQLLNSVQEAALGDRLDEAIDWLAKAQKEIGLLRSFENTTTTTILNGKAAELNKAIIETIEECWNDLIQMDRSTGRISIKNEVQRASPIDVHTIVLTLTKLGLLNAKINELFQGFHKIILAPRLTVGPDNVAAAISVTADDIQVTGRLPNADVKVLFDDVDTIIDYLSTRLPPTVAVPLSELLMPSLISQLVSDWLLPSVPSSLDGMVEFQEILAQVLRLADVVESVGWHGKSDLLDWVDQAPRVWLTKRRETSLDKVRTVLGGGLGKVKKVERIETEVVAPEDGTFHGQGGEDDWNTEWSDGEDSRKAMTSSIKKNEEDEASAWGLDDELDVSETADKSAQVSGNNGEDEAEDAWGWDDEKDQDVPMQHNATEVNKVDTRSNGHASHTARQFQRELTLKEVYSITALPEAILEVIVQVVSDAETLAQPNYIRSPITPAAAGLFTIPTLILAMYRATAPTYYTVDVSGSMFLYNDSLWLAEQLRTFAHNQSLRAGAKSPRAIGRLKLDPDIQSLEVFAKRAYGKEMNTQRTILGDLLDGAQGFANSTEPPFAGECDLAVSSTVDRIRVLHDQWKGVLSHSALLQSLGSLLGTVIHKVIMDVEDMSDISEPESQRLASFCNQISKLEDLFVSEQMGETQPNSESAVPLTAVYTPNWLRFQYLSNILDSSLVDIKYLWSEGELRLEFTADELIDLIEALFADSEHRRKAIAEIRRSALVQ